MAMTYTPAQASWFKRRIENRQTDTTHCSTVPSHKRGRIQQKGTQQSAYLRHSVVISQQSVH